MAPSPDAVLEKLRGSLKRRGAEGIRGLGRHFKVSSASAARVATTARTCKMLTCCAPVAADL